MKDCPCTGLRLKLTFMQSFYFQVVNQLPNGQPILKGIEPNLLNNLANAINFTYDLDETGYGQYGRILPNKTWTGVVGRLSSESSEGSDFGLAGLSVTEGRRAVIDFSVPYIQDSFNFFVGVENATRSEALFLSPFEYNVWLVALSCAIVVLMFLRMYFCVRHEPGFKLRSFMIVFGIAAKQGVNVNNVQLSASLVIISWLMSCTILNIFYGNELKATTSIPKKDDISTVDHLASILQLGKMKILIEEHNSIEERIANMPSTPYGDLFRQVSEIRKPRPSDYADIFARRITTAVSRNRMELRLLKAGYPPSKILALSEPLMRANTAIGFRKNFTCQASFNWIIIALAESGCLQQWQEELRFPLTMQEMKDKDSATVVNYIRLSDLKSTFGLIFISYFVSFVAVTLQRCKRSTKHAFNLTQKCNTINEHAENTVSE